MSWPDVMTAIEGFNDEQISESNKFRHLVLAPAWAMGSKAKVRDVLPLPIDNMSDKKPVTKEYFKAMVAHFDKLDKNKKAQA